MLANNKENIKGISSAKCPPRVAVVIISLHVKAKDRRHSARLHKHKIEPRYGYIWLEMLSGTYLSVKSLQMDIFPQQLPSTSQGSRCIYHKVGVFSQGGRMGGLPGVL